MILTPLQKLPNNVEDLGKLIVAKGLKKLPKVKKIAQSGHTDSRYNITLWSTEGQNMYDLPITRAEKVSFYFHPKENLSNSA